MILGLLNGQPRVALDLTMNMVWARPLGTLKANPREKGAAFRGCDSEKNSGTESY